MRSSPTCSSGNISKKLNPIRGSMKLKDYMLHSCDKEEALIPGMMNEFGLTKQMMFFKMCEKFIAGTQCILIDDLVERDSFQVERLNDGVSIALFNPKDL